MLCAVVEDLSEVAGVEVETTWDSRLGNSPFGNIRAVCVESPTEEPQIFRRLAAACDATLLIAPEFQGILSGRCRIVEEAGGRLTGPSSRAVALCSDKLLLAAHLREAGIETISTRPVDWLQVLSPLPHHEPTVFPIVIKPRDGAGSQYTFLVKGAGELARLSTTLAKESAFEFIQQPYVAGTPVSVGLIIAPSGTDAEVFPPANQILSDDGRFRYLGGQIPLDQLDHRAVQRAAQSACHSVAGLRGYVGVDLIVPDRAPDRPVVVEINPRLTTSYLGYRQMTDDNLAERILTPACFQRPISWRAGSVTFDCAGNVRAASNAHRYLHIAK